MIALPVALSMLLTARQGQRQPAVHLIPYPARVEASDRTHHFSGPPVIRADPEDTELLRLARHAARLLEEPLGRPARVGSRTRRGAGVILLRLDPVFPDTSREAYALETGDDGVRVTARGHAGLFYGLQTLRQLVRSGPQDGWAVRGVRILDRPRFAYRGMHLDVARHFFPVEIVKRYIDLLARYKLNTFHWHLTDDQGWRIEIRRYPRLTRVGAYRRETILGQSFDPYLGDGVPHGGFYTQDEIRDVVAYAAERYVMVIPEIEMPGHSVAALAAYPELACTPGPFEVATRWGVFDDILCPSERTFEFLEGVLGEVIDLFPGPYIHVGGDEVPKRRWRESELAQELIRREGLVGEGQLQSYFISRIERFLHRHARRLIGWDEILEGGLPPRATVMSWRGMAGGLEAARLGHDVIMSPTDYAYFDYYQSDPAAEPLAIGGLTPLEKVYAFEPAPDELSPEEARHVLGPQANLWTEYVSTPQHLEYMLLPRLLALAEVAWSPRESRSWASFEARLPAALERLDRLGVNYRIPDVRGLDAQRLALDSTIVVALASPIPGAAIHYTTDGSEPGPHSSRYQSPITLELEQPIQVKARLVLLNGRSGPVSTGLYRRATLRPGVVLDESRLGEGIRYAYVERQIASVRELARGEPAARVAIVSNVALQGEERDEHFALSFTGYFRAPADGVYRFTLLSDDGSALWVGDELVVDHDGPHGPTERAGDVALAAGYHPITVVYFQAGGGKLLELFVTPAGGERMRVPSGWLRGGAAR